MNSQIFLLISNVFGLMLKFKLFMNNTKEFKQRLDEKRESIVKRIKI